LFIYFVPKGVIQSDIADLRGVNIGNDTSVYNTANTNTPDILQENNNQVANTSDIKMDGTPDINNNKKFYNRKTDIIAKSSPSDISNDTSTRKVDDPDNNGYSSINDASGDI
jgi:hypothetical protein